MSYGDTWLNADGLLERKGTLNLETSEGGFYTVKGNIKQFEHKLFWDNLPDTNAITGTQEQAIPANAVIQRAYLVVDTAFTSGGLTTLDIGLKQADGTAIDATGIDVAIAKATLAQDAVVACDGALIGTRITADGFISTTTTTGPWTAGEATLVIEYLV